MTIGKAIAEKRKAAGMTQTQVGIAAGMSQTHVSAIEVGKMIPVFTTLQVLAGAMNMSVSALVEGL